MMDFETEIDRLESLLGNLEAAQQDALETEYYSYIANSLELDVEQIKSRLEELYSLQNDQWSKEMKEQNLQYERSVL